MNWTPEDQQKARHEGWAILFQLGGIIWDGALRGKYKPLKKVRIKTAAVQRYVQRRAEAGSEFHQRALKLLVIQRLTS